jgi:hypothetical protein
VDMSSTTAAAFLADGLTGKSCVCCRHVARVVRWLDRKELCVLSTRRKGCPLNARVGPPHQGSLTLCNASAIFRTQMMGA